MIAIHQTAAYVAPGQPGSIVDVAHRYDNLIGGHWVPPALGGYRVNHTPVTGKPFCEVADSGRADVDRAIAAAQLAQSSWGRTSPARRGAVLDAIADRIDAAREPLAVAESWDNGKPVREVLDFDLPSAVAHLRCVAALLRHEHDTPADPRVHLLHQRQPLGVVAQLLPFNNPLLSAVWDLAPALAGGNTCVLKPAHATPWSLLKFSELVLDHVPSGIFNVVNGDGRQIGAQLSHDPRVAMVRFTGERGNGRTLVSQAAAAEIPAVADVGGNATSIVFADVLDRYDDLLDATLQGLLLFAFNQGESSACPARALIQQPAYDALLERLLARVGTLRQGNPLDPETQVGAQVSPNQLARVADYVRLGMREGAKLLAGCGPPQLPRALRGGCYYAPTVLEGESTMRVFREAIFGPVLVVAPFADEREAIELANATPTRVAAGVWTRDRPRGLRTARALQTRRAWVDSYRVHPAQAPEDEATARHAATLTAQDLLDRYTQPLDVFAGDEPPTT